LDARRLRRVALSGGISARIVPHMSRHAGILASARLIAVLTLVSRILGLGREAVFSYFFSTTELMSAYRLAYMIPNLARRLFGEGALSSAMIPVLTDSLEKRGEEPSRRFVGSVLVLLVLVLAGLVLFGEVVVLCWRAIREDQALEFTAILLPYMGFICVTAVASGVLNVRNRFGVPAFTPVILNVVIIVGVVGAAKIGVEPGRDLLYALCICVLVAGVLQMAFVFYGLWRASFLPIVTGPGKDPEVRRVVRLMAPMMLGLSAVQINSLADYLIAYVFVFVDGERVGTAVLGFAHNLYQLPLGVFGISLATAIFPVLSAMAVKNDRPGLAATASRGIRFGLFIAIPAAAGLILVAEPLVASILQHGRFGPNSTERVAGVLIMYSLGLPAYFAQHVVIRTYYALEDSRTPARIALCMVGVNIVLNLSLVMVMEERGLALATAICAAIQVLWLAMRLRRVLPEFDWRPVYVGGRRIVAATVVMVVVLLGLRSSWVLGRWSDLPASVVLAVLVVAGVVVYGFMAWVLPLEDAKDLLRRRK